MKLVVNIHLWFPRFLAMIRNWFDFGVDLSGLALDEEDLAIDLNTGRD